MFSVYWRNYCDWLRSGPGVTINLILAHSGPICMYDCLCCILDEMDINSLCRSRWWQQSVLLQWIFWFAAGVIWVKMQDCGDRVCSWTSEQSVSQNVVNWIIESCFNHFYPGLNQWLTCLLLIPVSWPSFLLMWSFIKRKVDRDRGWQWGVRRSPGGEI